MSQDFQLAWYCPHLISEEYVTLGSDGMSLVTEQPIANSGIVRILVNDEFFIPQLGLYSQGTLRSSLSGPFDLIPGEDEVILTTSAGTQSYVFGVRKVTRYSAEQVAQILRKASLNVAHIEADGGHLTLVDTASVGPDSFVALSGTAAASLGFGAAGVNALQRRARGALLFPPWDLYTPPSEPSKRYPRFREPLRGNPVLKVSYSVHRTRCLRCGTSGIENDLRFDSAGQTLMIRDENLLQQAVLKILLTDKGSNPYHLWYGTDLKSRIGSKAISGVAALISEDVRRALSRYQALQLEQAKYQSVSFKERLYAVTEVKVTPHAQDPTIFMLSVTVQNASSQPVTLDVVYATSQVVALMGSNGLSLGTDALGIINRSV